MLLDRQIMCIRQILTRILSNNRNCYFLSCMQVRSEAFVWSFVGLANVSILSSPDIRYWRSFGFLIFSTCNSNSFLQVARSGRTLASLFGWTRLTEEKSILSWHRTLFRLSLSPGLDWRIESSTPTAIIDSTWLLGVARLTEKPNRNVKNRTEPKPKIRDFSKTEPNRNRSH